jgi:hypothetical protein
MYKRIRWKRTCPYIEAPLGEPGGVGLPRKFSANIWKAKETWREIWRKGCITGDRDGCLKAFYKRASLFIGNRRRT